MLFWHWFFFLLPFDTPTWQCCLAWQWKRKREWFWLTGLSLSFCKGCFLSFAIWKCRAIWEGKADLISHCTHYLACSEGERTEETTRFAFLLPPSRSFSGSQSTVEALPFALLVLTLNPKVFWCETCLLCVDVCFV